MLAEAVAAFEADFKEALRQAGTLQGEVASFFGYAGGGGGGGGGAGGSGGGTAQGGGAPGDDAGRVPPCIINIIIVRIARL